MKVERAKGAILDTCWKHCLIVGSGVNRRFVNRRFVNRRFVNRRFVNRRFVNRR